LARRQVSATRVNSVQASLSGFVPQRPDASTRPSSSSDQGPRHSYVRLAAPGNATAIKAMLGLPEADRVELAWSAAPAVADGRGGWM
jgi:hypothetical protein